MRIKSTRTGGPTAMRNRIGRAGRGRRRSASRGCRARVQEALGELAGAAKEGLLALSVGVGLGVLHELMEAEVDEVVGPKGKHDPGPHRGASRPRGRRGHARRPARAGRAGRGPGPPTASARSSWRPTRTSPRATRSTDVMLERMLAGVSTRRYARTRRAGRRATIDAGRAVDEQVGGQPRVRLAHARAPDRADDAARSTTCAWRW